MYECTCMYRSDSAGKVENKDSAAREWSQKKSLILCGVNSWFECTRWHSFNILHGNNEINVSNNPVNYKVEPRKRHLGLVLHF